MENPTLVRGLQRTDNLETKPHRFIRCQRALWRRAVDVLEHEITRADIVDLTNVRVVQACDRTRFFFEPAQPIGLRGELRGQDFDGDCAIKASVLRPIYLPHAAGAERGKDFVRAEPGASGEGHATTPIVAAESKAAKDNGLTGSTRHRAHS